MKRSHHDTRFEFALAPTARGQRVLTTGLSPTLSLAASIPRRLEKFLRDSTPLSVDEGRRAHRAGRVRVFPPGAAQPMDLEVDDLIYAEDRVLLDGEALTPRQVHTYIMFNKPRQVTTTLRDPLGKRDLTEYLARMPPGVFPVGRLDRDTTGLLLCTNDGDLANAILHPDHQTEKIYWLWLNEALDPTDPRLRQLVEGVPLRGYVAKAAAVHIVALTACCSELLVTLREGKNRQIRRMCRALNFYLHHLHRKAIGPLRIDGVELGSFRHLSQNEVSELWASTGGRALAEQRKIVALGRRALQRRSIGRPDTRLERWLADRAHSPGYHSDG